MLIGDMCDEPDCTQQANVYVIYLEGDSLCLACFCWDHRHCMDDFEVAHEPIIRERWIHEV